LLFFVVFFIFSLFFLYAYDTRAAR